MLPGSARFSYRRLFGYPKSLTGFYHGTLITVHNHGYVVPCLALAERFLMAADDMGLTEDLEALGDKGLDKALDTKALVIDKGTGSERWPASEGAVLLSML